MIEEAPLVVVNRLIHDAWQAGYRQALADVRSNAGALTEAGLQHDGNPT